MTTVSGLPRAMDAIRKIPTSLPGVVILEPRVFGDERGFFLESYNAKALEGLGIKEQFVQDNHSGEGEILDVAVDVRRRTHQFSLRLFDLIVQPTSSPTFGRWEAVRLSGENKRMLWIPVGFAHGFRVTSESAQVLYKATDYYAPEHERTLAWNDPDLKIDWELEGDPIVSAKDQRGIALRDASGLYGLFSASILGSGRFPASELASRLAASGSGRA